MLVKFYEIKGYFDEVLDEENVNLTIEVLEKEGRRIIDIKYVYCGDYTLVAIHHEKQEEE